MGVQVNSLKCVRKSLKRPIQLSKYIRNSLRRPIKLSKVRPKSLERPIEMHEVRPKLALAILFDTSIARSFDFDQASSMQEAHILCCLSLNLFRGLSIIT